MFALWIGGKSQGMRSWNGGPTGAKGNAAIASKTKREPWQRENTAKQPIRFPNANSINL